LWASPNRSAKFARVPEPESTEAVARAAGVDASTVRRWSKKNKVLPAYVDQHAGAHGRRGVWPAGSGEIARLVRRMLDLGLTFEQIREVQGRLSLDEQRAACESGAATLLKR